MEVEDDTFFVVQSPNKMHVYQTQSESIDHLRSNADKLNAEDPDITISEVTVDGEDWTIKQLPWQRIAVKLMQSEE